MRLSASLLDDWSTCQFKTKLRYLDYEEMPLTPADIGALYFGRLAHAGMDAYLHANCPQGNMLMVGPAICAAAQRELHGRASEETIGTLVRRTMTAVVRWRDFFQPQPGRGVMVNKRHILRLNPPIGVFDEFVIQPDYVYRGEDGELTLVDWKWVNKIESEEDERDALSYDLQSAIYQYGLFCLDTPVVRISQVRGLREEPTPFRVNQDGFVSRRPVRNSYAAYVLACANAGHPPDPGLEMKLMPFFRHPVIFRSRAEVLDIWNEVVVPRALEISRAMEHGFTRRMSRYACLRCPFREPCWAGARGYGSGAFATALSVGRRTTDAVEASDLD